MDKDALGLLRIDRSGDQPGARPGRSRKARSLWALAVAVTGLALFYFSRSSGPPVELGVVSMQRPSQALVLLNASGYVVAQRKASVAAKTTGRLVWLGVEEASRVKTDEILARLDSDDVKAAAEKARGDLDSARHIREEAQAELTDARLNHDRLKILVDRKIIARADYDAAVARLRKAEAVHRRAKSGVEAAEASLRQAEVYREFTLLRAPFDGVVLTKNADVGDIVTPLGAAANAKASVVTLADMGSLEVEADVSESNLGKVKQDQPCEISLDSIPGERFPGRVHIIAPTADRSKATVMVKVRFDRQDPRILPEMSAKAAFLEREPTPAENENAPSLPRAALARRGDRDVVFVLDPKGRALETPITQTGPAEAGAEFISLAPGVLKPGDKVVLSPGASLRTGDKLTLKEK
ncbi:MAG: efflux RND transporter periplasmic adaptor subunit [Desulfovibrionaceae bacterium]|nr:efflux RND transporter periplasmic adaptor subunit [Desulfovibrionaceae bacterium]